MADSRYRLLFSLMRMKSNLDAIDDEYWPDVPDEPYVPLNQGLHSYIQLITDEMTSHFTGPSASQQVRAVVSAFDRMARQVPGATGHSAHVHWTADEQSADALKSIARGETIEEWRARTRNHGPPQPDRTHARHNKHRGKGKRKK